MTDTIRNLLISLSSHMAYMQGQLEACYELHNPENAYWYRESVLLRQKVTDALADEPAAREPAAVTGQPSDEELYDYWLSTSPELGCDAVRFALAVLARWGNPAPAPPADGEVAELVAEIRHFLAGYRKMRGLDPEHIYSIHRGDKMEAHITVSRLTRAAELLQRQALVPVSVSERPWEREGWCDEDDNCWLGGNSLDGRTPTWIYAPFAWAERFQNVHRILLPAHALPLPEVGE